MAKTPICIFQIFLWKVIVTGYTECFRVQGTKMYCKVLGFTVVYRGEGVHKPNRIFILTQTINYMNLEKIFRFKKVLDRYLQSSRTNSFIKN